MHELEAWDSFYLIIGGAAAALIGLQFVAMTLIASLPGLRKAEAGAAFATPTIVHFCAAFLIAAIVRAPWKAVTTVAVLWGIIGLAGVVYTVIVTRRMQKQKHYEPVFEDWLFHCMLPFVGYGVLAVSAFAASGYEREALFALGASELLLLFIGIHNSWDAVTYNIFVTGESSEEPKAIDDAPGGDESEQV